MEEADGGGGGVRLSCGVTSTEDEVGERGETDSVNCTMLLSVVLEQVGVSRHT